VAIVTTLMASPIFDFVYGDTVRRRASRRRNSEMHLQTARQFQGGKTRHPKVNDGEA
jgi:hypothetical protein